MAPENVTSDVHDDVPKAKSFCTACVDAQVVSDPDSLAVLNAKYWGPEARILKVSFLESAPQELREKIVRVMNEWDCCVRFELVSATCLGKRLLALLPQTLTES